MPELQASHLPLPHGATQAISIDQLSENLCS